MSALAEKNDPFIGLKLEGYVIKRQCGLGKIASGVYYAKRDGAIPDERAIKFMPTKTLRRGWQNEISKVTKLGLTDRVVPYIKDGKITISGQKYTWIAWKFIKGKSLKELAATLQVTVPLVCDVVEQILSVLHGCSKIGIQHGDLHSGNILIEDSNEIYINPEEQRIWVTDFGYLTNSMGKDILDDYHGLVGIINECLGAIDFHALNGQDKLTFSAIKRKVLRDLQESDATQGDFVRNPRKLLERFQIIRLQEKTPDGQELKRVGDYLAAEHIGERYDEWKSLFVPSFVGSDQLLGRNICVLTGLRGCGKTMLFRRLTALFDFHLGASGVPGAESFTGFYFNARSLAEAFPWLPADKEADARDQVINYFHVSLILEILEWLSFLYQGKKKPPIWLAAFFKRFYEDELIVTESNELIIRHLKSFFAQELEKCRLKSGYIVARWRLARLDFLDQFTKEIEKNIESTTGKPFYFFIDDYSSPLVTEATQRILNSVLFRRSARTIFKIATESIESIELEGLHNKSLEQEDDFVLIDSGTETIQRSKIVNRKTIADILQPRIERDSRLAKRNLTLVDILGNTPYNNIELAEQLRSDPDKDKKNVKYHGLQVFCDLWSSNVREIISIFADMITTETPERITAPPPGESLISISLQNKNFRNAGSKYRSLLIAATDPTKKLSEIAATDRSYGEHLQKIADAFHQIAAYDLQNKTSKNVANIRPKQARRIEIADVSQDLPSELLPYYRGMIRYGLFIRDWRGKSARGKAVPRLYLRSILIPFYTLSFSKRDAITMEWPEFCEFLRNPREFAVGWPSLKPPKSNAENSGKQDSLPGLTK